ncbi:hypothetical protein ACFRU3_39140 [Streptomyces sp. NPDC056910]|uniref:hypothetical protein n=1 Tax=Streptomyces sp. NPDC056910 TaxID=3345964 RepID=UPI0036795413
MLLGRLAVRAQTVADGATPGLVTTVTADATGQKLVHLINFSVQPQRFTLTVAGELYAGGTVLELPARTGLMLPLDVRLDGAVLRWATAELDEPRDGPTLSLRRGAGPGSALLETDRTVVVEDGSRTERTEGGVLVTWPGGADGERLDVRLA